MRLLLAMIAMVTACREGGGPAEPAPAVPRRGDAAPVDREPLPPQAADAGPRMEGGFFMATGAPAPLACTADSDCTVDSTRRENGCCLAGVWVPQSIAYSRWGAAWRQKHCAQVRCPPPPAPYPPEKCATEARCTDGRCTHRCAPAAGP